MTTTTRTRSGRFIGRVSGIWSELEYAQRRMFEIRAGLYEPRPTRSVYAEAGRRRYEERGVDEFQC
jgi:hypothetical protein